MAFQIITPGGAAPVFDVGPPPLTQQQRELKAFEQEKLEAGRQDLQRKQAEAEAYDTILRETGGDPDLMIPRLRGVNPMAAAKLEQEVATGREGVAKALKAEWEADLAEGEHGLALLRSVSDDASYQRMLPTIKKYLPELAANLPPVYDPEVLRQMQEYGGKASEHLARNLDALKFRATGDMLRFAAFSLSTADTPEERAETIKGLRSMGVDQATINMIPDVATAERLALKPDEYADNVEANRSNTVKETETNRGNLVDEAERERENRAQDVTARRGQDISAQTSRRGQDVSAATAKAGKAGEGGDLDMWIAAVQADPGQMNNIPLQGRGEVVAEMTRRGLDPPPAVPLSAGQQKELMGAGHVLRMAARIKALGDKIQWRGIGPIEGPWSNLMVKAGQNKDVEAMRLRQELDRTKAEIGRLVSGQAIAESEMARLSQFLPSFGDADAEVPVKIQGMVDWANDKIAELKGSAGKIRTGPAAAPAAPVGFSLKLPDGRTATFKTQADMDKAKAALGIR